MALNVTFVRSYRKDNEPMFVYMVTGTAKELAAYKESMGQYHRTDDDGNSLWFSRKFITDSGRLIITSTGKVVPDLSEFDKAASIVRQYGGDLGAEMAKAAALSLLGSRVAHAPATPAAPHVEESPELQEDLNDL